MKELEFSHILDMIKAKQPFSYARYGDGEWNCILQKKPGGHNCDGHTYFPDLGEELKRILESKPDYFLGLQRLAAEQNESDPEFRRLVNMNEWVENELIHRASIKGYLKDLIDLFEYNTVIVVGNASLNELPFHIDALVQIPDKDCWTEFSSIKRQIGELIEGGEIILYCASMMSEVLIHEFKDCNLIQIDCGSVFDPYVGRNTRSYHKNLQLP